MTDKKERQWRTAQQPKCACGACLSLLRQQEGIDNCPRCDREDGILSAHVMMVPWCNCCDARVEIDHICECERG